MGFYYNFFLTTDWICRNQIIHIFGLFKKNNKKLCLKCYRGAMEAMLKKTIWPLTIGAYICILSINIYKQCIIVVYILIMEAD